MTALDEDRRAALTDEVEQFLFEEAVLLDAWRLRDWLELLTADCRYLVPSPDAPEATDPVQALFVIADDHARIVARVERLESDAAWVERPRSRTRRLISNVRVRFGADGELRAHANFAIYRTRRGVVDILFGQYTHRLVRGADGTLRIRERRAKVDSETIRPHGVVSIIV